MMTKASATALAAWMLKHQPGVFAAILKAQGTKLSGLGDATITPDMSQFDITSSLAAAPDASYTASIDPSVADATTSGLLSSLGSGLSSAVSNVGAFLLKGTATLAPVAIAALNAQSNTANRNAQLAVLGAQMNRAGAGLAPANVQYTANGTPVYVPTASPTGGLTTIPAGLGAPVTLPSGQVGYTLTPQSLTNLAPTFLQKYGIWIVGGGVALVAVILISRR